MTASSTTPIPPLRADSMASGACTSGSTAHPKGATRRECGGAGTTSTPSAERDRDWRDADARWLDDDGDAVDADAGTNVARRRSVFPRRVGRDDGGDDAAVALARVVALPPSC